MEVYKFGGAALKDAEGYERVASLVKKVSGLAVIVASAGGKTTNGLEELVSAISAQKYSEALSMADTLVEAHLDLGWTLLGDLNHPAMGEIHNLGLSLKSIADGTTRIGTSGSLYSEVVCYGELWSSRILSGYLNKVGIPNLWIDARNLIRTSNAGPNAEVLLEQSNRLLGTHLGALLQKSLVVTQGFIGKTADGLTSTLGREGSDYSASLIASAIGAQKLTLWKDVSGIYTGDPRRFKDAKQIPALGYVQALQLSAYGATILHPKTVLPLRLRGITMQLRSFLAREEKGTLVTAGEGIAASDHVWNLVKSRQAMVQLVPKRDVPFEATSVLASFLKDFAPGIINYLSLESEQVILCIPAEVAPKATFPEDENLEDTSSSYFIKVIPHVEVFTLMHGDKAAYEEALESKEPMHYTITAHMARYILQVAS